jgi:arsenate reductase-like glutaredoxin family protein
MMVTIYHNPEYGTSRNTLMIRQSGEQPHIIESESPPRHARLIELIGATRISVRSLLRKKGIFCA